MTRESRFGCVCDTISCVSCVCAKYGKTTTAVVVVYIAGDGIDVHVSMTRFARYKPTTRTRRAHWTWCLAMNRAHGSLPQDPSHGMLN